MPLTLIDKTPGDPLRSQDWNAHVHETQRLDQDKVDRTGDTITGALTINGALTAAANATINGALTAVGNVGIGAGAPDRNLTIQGGPSAYLNLKTAGNAQQLLIGADSGGGLISTMTNHDLQLRAGGNVNRMIVKANGNVGIGGDPQTALHVFNGNIRVDEGEYQNWGPLVLHADVDNSGDGEFHFRGTNNQELMTILANGNVGIGATSPVVPLQFSSTLGNKICLWGTNALQNYGFGIQNATLQIYGDIAGTSVAFGWGSSSNFHETMRIQGDGRLIVQGDYYGKGHVFLHAFEGDGANGTAYVQARDNTGKTSIGLTLRTTNGGAVIDAIRIDPGGQAHFSSLTGVGKFFRIDHPAKAGYDLIHACMEGPENGVYYRGTARLVDGEAIITLPEYFEALTRKEDRTVQLTPQGGKPFLLSAGEVADGRFKAHGTEPNGAFCWEVKAVRADVAPLEVEVEKQEPSSLRGQESGSLHSVAAKG